MISRVQASSVLRLRVISVSVPRDKLPLVTHSTLGVTSAYLRNILSIRALYFHSIIKYHFPLRKRVNSAVDVSKAPFNVTYLIIIIIIGQKYIIVRIKLTLESLGTDWLVYNQPNHWKGKPQQA